MHSFEFVLSGIDSHDKQQSSVTHPLCSVHSPPSPPPWSNLASFPPQGHCEGSYSSATPGSRPAPCFSCLNRHNGSQLKWDFLRHLYCSEKCILCFPWKHILFGHRHNLALSIRNTIKKHSIEPRWGCGLSPCDVTRGWSNTLFNQSFLKL